MAQTELDTPDENWQAGYDAGYDEAMRRVVVALERAGCADGMSVLAAAL